MLFIESYFVYYSMIQFIVLTVIALIVTLVLAVSKGADIIISPIMGVLLGGLYDKAYYEDENVTDHTLQVSLLFIVFTVKWETYDTV